MILSTVIEGTLRVYHRAPSGALTMVAQLSGAKPDPNTVAAIVSDLEMAFDWTPMDQVPPKRALPKPAKKPKVVRRSRSEIARLQADILDAILHAPRDVRELAEQFDVPTHVVEHRVRTLAAQGLIVRVQYADIPKRYRYHPVEGGGDDVGADDAGHAPEQ